MGIPVQLEFRNGGANDYNPFMKAVDAYFPGSLAVSVVVGVQFEAVPSAYFC